MKKTILIGQRFGKLVVIEESEKRNGNVAWKCLCDCGKETTSLSYNLTSGKSKSCGCVRGEKVGELMRTHGQSKTRLYGIYKGMKQRCNNKNTPAYKYYGGKGVSICPDWLNDFLKFKEWSINNGYLAKKSIDRRNPNGNYCPENCRWVDLEKQQNNKLNSFFLSIDGDKRTIAEWAKYNKINKQTLYSKFYRLFKDLNLTDKDFELIIKTQ